ncbi:MAG: UDP-2,4-diacetamido-2,4,6-trideoxy-beta-L-altropyranose hydrolase [Lachnospiraceae bacterium]|nr:UDP-2,4-diacetamido-2,4,6-trideoxy-beta-L-altropyranose hydrolase [Lachnospiraceae bacterium]
MICIRADMNDTVGLGHMMRCLSIADALKEKEPEVLFLTADEQGAALLEKRGYEYVVLYSEWDHLEGELSSLESFFSTRGKSCSLLIIDTYQITQRYLGTLKTFVPTLLIDDIPLFSYDVDSVLCYGIYYKNYYPKDRKDCLFGPAYAPLRKEFQGAGEKLIREAVENVLILSGGTDANDMLRQIVRQIDTKKYRRIDIVCGLYYPEYDDFVRETDPVPEVILHKNISNISEYMKDADIAVSAGGSTLYELCALGTPTISYCLEDNQMGNVEGFDRSGIIPSAGDIRKDPVLENIVRLLEELAPCERRRKLSKGMQRKVDGRGAERIADFIIARYGDDKTLARAFLQPVE